MTPPLHAPQDVPAGHRPGPVRARLRPARAVAALLAAAALAACTSGAGSLPSEELGAAARAGATPLPSTAQPTVSPDPGPRPFAPTSFWNRPLPATAGTAATGADDLAARLARQTRYDDTTSPVRGLYAPGFGVNVNMSDFSVPVYTVPADQPRLPVVLVDERGVPRPPGWALGLPEQLAAVPLPTDVGDLAAAGSDRHVVVWQPSTDTMWEFWVFRPTAESPPRYTARYGGRIDRVSQASGVLPNRWGARATSLALLGGVVRMREYASGVVPHALALAVPVLSDGFLPPATRDDGPGASVASGNAAPDAVPEGARFRLPAGYDCTTAVPDGVPPLVRMLCVAARDHGIVVVDRTGGTVSFFAEDDKTVGTSYSDVTTSPWRDVALGGPASRLTDAFPWQDLVTVPPSA